MNTDKMICKCKKVTKGDIIKAMEKGALSYKNVKKATGAGAKCGHCESEVRKFIKKHRDEIHD